MSDVPNEAIIERLVRIETKIDGVINRGEDHETRIRKLERAVWVATGAAATVGGAVGSVLKQVLGA